MNPIEFLWTTDPGMVTLALFAFAFIMLIVSYLTKFSIPFVIIDLIIWVAAIAAAGAVLGIWALPFFDYFNLMEIADTEHPL